MTALRAAEQKRFLVGFVHWTVRGISLSNTCQSRSEARLRLNLKVHNGPNRQPAVAVGAGSANRCLHPL